MTATETLMMIAARAAGKSELINAACEPEIIALSEFLILCGAKIKGAGTPHIVIEGVKHLNGATFSNIPDRVEAGSFGILAMATKSPLVLEHCNPQHLEVLWSFLKEAGAKIACDGTSVALRPPPRLKATSLKTREYPGFPTDLQGPWITLMTQAAGQSFVHETIYDGRLFWTEDLKRMNAQIVILDPHRVMVTGPTQLHGREIESPDIRAGMAFLIAALIARGETIIHNVYQIDRGYERIEERLNALGARISRIENQNSK